MLSIFIQNFGKVMKPWYNQIKAFSDFPLGICTYDVIKGYSATKGKIKVTSYRNKGGQLLRRERTTSYKGKNEVTIQNFIYDNFLTFIQTKTMQSGRLIKNEYKTLCSYDNGSVVELTEQIGSSPSLDTQMVRYLRPKQSPRVINVEDPWGNTKITSPKCSSGRMTMLEDRQYLPTVISNMSKERTNERVKNIEEVLANRNNISASRTKTQRVSQEVLNPQAEMNNDITYGNCNMLGEVRIWDELYMTPDLYETMGHEFNHSKWFQYMDDVSNNDTAGIKRKIFITAKKLWNEFNEEIPYEKRKIEDLALKEEPKVKQKFLDMFDNIVRFFEKS